MTTYNPELIHSLPAGRDLDRAVCELWPEWAKDFHGYPDCEFTLRKLEYFFEPGGPLRGAIFMHHEDYDLMGCDEFSVQAGESFAFGTTIMEAVCRCACIVKLEESDGNNHK